MCLSLKQISIAQLQCKLSTYNFLTRKDAPTVFYFN